MRAAKFFFACLLGSAVFLLPQATPASAAEPIAETTTVFDQFSSAVAKIQIVGERAEAKASLGSGFFIEHAGARRHLVTNYHVISQALLHPETYRIERVDEEGETSLLKVAAVDVVNDLALLVGEFDSETFLPLATVMPAQGERIYSLGHPHDLGLTIVEGTFNGLMADDWGEKIHLTAAINPGMSGGPTILSDGHVVGINVESAGNQVGFVIPSSLAGTMAERAAQPDYVIAEDLTDEVRRQLLAHQDAFLAEVLSKDRLETQTLGPFEIPSDFASFLNCWGQDSDQDDALFESTLRSCSLRDSIFLEDGLQSGVIALEHRYMETSKLDPVRFYSLYESQFSGAYYGGYGHTEDLTEYVCDTAYVEAEADARTATEAPLVLKTVFCARRYVKLAELYDVVFKVATLGDADRGLTSRLTLSGVSFENGRGLAERFLRSIRRRAE